MLNNLLNSEFLPFSVNTDDDYYFCVRDGKLEKVMFLPEEKSYKLQNPNFFLNPP